MSRIYEGDLPYDSRVSRTHNHEPNEIGTARPLILDTLDGGVACYLETISRLPIREVLEGEE